MNRNYGKLNDGAIEYAPNNIRIGDTIYAAPTADHYAAAGYMVVHAEPPTAPAAEGKHYEQDGWEVCDGAIWCVWREVEDPPRVAVYSVEEIIYGLITAGALQPVKQVVGDYWELLTMCETIAADNEIFAANFAAIKSAIVASGALTAEQIDGILAEAEVA